MPPRDPHIIRLAGPWEHHAPDGTVTRERLPRDAADRPCTLLRRFNRPTGLEGATVTLLADAVPPDAAATLNDRPFTFGDDVTDRLGQANVLRVALPAGVPFAGPVRLVIFAGQAPA